MASYRNAPAWRQSKYGYPKGFATKLGPVTSVIDALSADAGGPSTAQALSNGWIERQIARVGVRTRPAFAVATMPLSTNPLIQLGGVLPGNVQGNFWVNIQGYIRQIIIKDGFVFVGPDESKRHDSQTDDLNYGADISPTGISVDPYAARVWVQYCANGYIFNDESGPPWYCTAQQLATAVFTGSAISGAVHIAVGASGALITAKGPPAIYDGCAFFIVPNADGSSNNAFTWSQPNQPLVGYQQTVGGFTYTNYASVSEAGQNNINAIVAENDALYYFRSTSIGSITGNVSTGFATSVVQDNISETIGCENIRAIFKVGADIAFMDISGRPWRLQDGGQLIPLADGAMTALYGTSTVGGMVSYTGGSAFPVAAEPPYITGGWVNGGAYGSDANVMVWSLTTATTPPTDVLLVFDGTSNQYLGTWSYSSLMTDTSNIGVQTFRALNTGSRGELTWVSMAGLCYTQLPRAFDPGVDYTLVQGGVVVFTAIELSMDYSPTQDDPLREKVFDRLDLEFISSFNLNAAQLQIALSYTTSQVSNPFVGSQPLQVLLSGLPQRLPWGIDGHGRYLSPKFTVLPSIVTGYPSVLTVNQSPFTLLGCMVQGWMVGDSPYIP